MPSAKREVLEKLAFSMKDYTIGELVVFAEQGKHLHELKTTSYFPLLVTVIENCPEKMLEEFVYHHDYRIRIAVARRGYALERLILDKNKGVIKAVSEYLKGLTQSGKSFKLVIED